MKTNIEKFEDYIEKTFYANSQRKTTDDLGDRSEYIGSSDISGCLRKTYLSKTEGCSWNINQQATFTRGHVSEGIIRMMLKSDDIELLEQVEAIGQSSNGFTLKAHIDFVARFKKADIIIEAKSTATTIEEPFDSWILQTQFQIALHQKQNPEKEVRGYIIAFSSNETPFSNGKVFKIFEVLPNSIFQKMAIERAEILSEALAKKQEPEAEVQMYCAKCAFKSDCPAITNMNAQQLPEDVQKVVDFVAQKSAVEKDIKAAKKHLQEFFEATGTKIAKSGDKTVSLVVNKGKKTANIEKLQSYPDVYANVVIDGDSYSYINVV